MLGSYQRSLLAILLAQFTKKRFSGGMAGVVRLATSSEPVQVRVHAGLLPVKPVQLGLLNLQAHTTALADCACCYKIPDLAPTGAPHSTLEMKHSADLITVVRALSAYGNVQGVMFLVRILCITNSFYNFWVRDCRLTLPRSSKNVRHKILVIRRCSWGQLC